MCFCLSSFLIRFCFSNPMVDVRRDTARCPRPPRKGPGHSHGAGYANLSGFWLSRALLMWLRPTPLAPADRGQRLGEDRTRSLPLRAPETNVALGLGTRRGRGGLLWLPAQKDSVLQALAKGLGSGRRTGRVSTGKVANTRTFLSLSQRCHFTEVSEITGTELKAPFSLAVSRTLIQIAKATNTFTLKTVGEPPT